MKSKLGQDVLVTVSGRFGTMAIQLGTTIVLARFLTPQDFGIVAMCSIFISLSDMLVDSGMAGSIIYHKDVEEIELHTLFWTNLAIATFLYCIIYLSSGYIADFYNVPILSQILKVIALSTIVHSFCIIQSTLLSKSLAFKIQSKIMILSAVCSSICTIALAFYIGGVWTLVWQPILLKVFQVVFFNIYGKYQIKFQFSLQAIKRHWNFGSKLLGVGVLKLIYDNIYVQVIGRVVNIKDAGYYAQAKRFNDIPLNLIAFPLERVIFPTLVSSSNTEEKMSRIYKAFVKILLPLLFLAALVSNDLILMLLGEKWKEAGWILSFLMIGTIGVSLESLNRNFIKVTGHTSKLLKSEVFKRILNIVVLGIGIFWSLKGILIAFIINGFLGWLMNSLVLGKLVDSFSVRIQLRQVTITLIFSLIPFFLILYCYSFLNLSISYFVDIVLKMVLYFLLYILILYVFDRQALVKVVHLLKQRVK